MLVNPVAAFPMAATAGLMGRQLRDRRLDGRLLVLRRSMSRLKRT